MKHTSFRFRLFISFVLVSAIPTILCAVLLQQVFTNRMEARQDEQLTEELAGVCEGLSLLEENLSRASEKICSSQEAAAALQGAESDETSVNNLLFAAAADCPVPAAFSLYTAEGALSFSTAAGDPSLPADWGILKAAEREDGLVFRAGDNPADTSRPVLYAARRIGNGGHPDRPAGFLVISLTSSCLKDLLDLRVSARNDLVLVDKHFRPVYSENPGLAAETAPKVRAVLLTGESLRTVSQEFSYRVSGEAPLGVYAILRSPEAFPAEVLALFRTIAVFAVLFSILTAIVTSFRFAGQLFTPIERLHQAMNEVTMEHLDVHVTPEGNDELAELTEHFNAMTHALQENRKKLIEGQRELNEAQIRMLQAQLNPHFLSNTLDTMKWISKINQVPQVALMSTDLAQILRFGISPEEFVPLEKELMILDRYMEIQQIRLSDRIDFAADVPPELLDCLVPKMILQPLVENCILHGCSDDGGGRIRVMIREKEGVLTIRVEDDGAGFPEELLGPYARSINDTGHHLGLYNVNTILKKHYGEAWGLLLENRENPRGAVITAAFPAQRRTKAEES